MLSMAIVAVAGGFQVDGFVTAAQQAPVAPSPGPPPQPPRDPSAQAQAPAIGKGSISGVVVVAGSGQPARRARLTLSAPQEGGGTRNSTTDDQGRFAFTALPAGRFNLSATKPGYLTGSYGQRRPSRPGTPIQLGEGQRLQAQLQIWRGGVITGTVLDEHGEAIPGTPVRAFRYVMQSGQRTLQSAGSGQTDDRGIYRIFGLQPGDYIVNATPRNTGAIVEAERLQTEIRSMTERIQGQAATNAVETQAVMERINAMRAMLPANAEEPASGYAPVYYPGTTMVAGAGTIPLGPGEEKGSIDFQYQVVPIARIEGMVTGVQTPQSVQITLVNTAFDVPGLNPGGARVDQNGAFRLANVPPGQYTIVARATINPNRDGAAGRGTPGAARGAAPAIAGRISMPANAQPTRLWAAADVTVDGRNISNVILALQQGMSVSGRLVFEGTTPPPTDLSRVRVSLSPIASPGTPGEVPTPAAGTADADGRFTIASVVPGRYRMTASVPGGQGWYLGSSMIDGQDSLDFPIDIKPNQAISSAVVTFVDRQTELAGTIVNERSQPVLDYSLIIYPADSRFWTPQSRRIVSTRPATDGRFTFRNLPAGEYRIAPVLDPEPGSWFDPTFLQQLDSGATRVSLGEGEKKEQNLRVQNGG
jgi:Carboxypeptidase regulatory-like domain/Polysaccharide lyase family 4, domain II